MGTHSNTNLIGTFDEYSKLLLVDKVGQPIDRSAIVACATLMLRVAYAQNQLLFSESRAIIQALQNVFHCSKADTLNLLKVADALQSPDGGEVDCFAILKDYYNFRQRTAVITLLWIVARADGQLEDKERRLIADFAKSLAVDPRSVKSAKSAAAKLGALHKKASRPYLRIPELSPA